MRVVRVIALGALCKVVLDGAGWWVPADRLISDRFLAAMSSWRSNRILDPSPGDLNAEYDLQFLLTWTISRIMSAPKAKAGTQNTLHQKPLSIDLERFSPANCRKLSAPALRTFLTIADQWGLTEEQRRLILGLPSHSTYQNWIKTAREHRELGLSLDVLTCISAVFGIHQGLACYIIQRSKALPGCVAPTSPRFSVDDHRWNS